MKLPTVRKWMRRYQRTALRCWPTLAPVIISSEHFSGHRGAVCCIGGRSASSIAGLYEKMGTRATIRRFNFDCGLLPIMQAHELVGCILRIVSIVIQRQMRVLR
jgi:hypothetical protein